MDYKNELRELFNIFNETNKAYNELASKVGLSYNQWLFYIIFKVIIMLHKKIL